MAEVSNTPKQGGSLAGPAILMAIVLGLAFPQLSLLKPALPWFLGLLLFTAYMREGLSPSRAWSKLSWSYLPFSMLIMPLVASFLSNLSSTACRQGLLLASFTPPALGAPVVGAILCADLEFIIGNVLFFNLTAPLIMTVSAIIWIPSKGGVSAMDIFTRITPIVFIPLFLALLFKNASVLRGVGKRAAGMISSAGAWFLAIVVMTAVSSAAGWLWKAPTEALISNALLTALLVGFSYLLGSFLNRGNPLAGALVFGHRNSGLTIYLALLSYGGEATVPMVIYMIFHHVVNALIMFFHRKRSKPRETDNEYSQQ